MPKYIGPELIYRNSLFHWVSVTAESQISYFIVTIFLSYLICDPEIQQMVLELTGEWKEYEQHCLMTIHVLIQTVVRYVY